MHCMLHTCCSLLSLGISQFSSIRPFPHNIIMSLLRYCTIRIIIGSCIYSALIFASHISFLVILLLTVCSCIHTYLGTCLLTAYLGTYTARTHKHLQYRYYGILPARVCTCVHAHTFYMWLQKTGCLWQSGKYVVFSSPSLPVLYYWSSPPLFFPHFR